MQCGRGLDAGHQILVLTWALINGADTDALVMMLTLSTDADALMQCTVLSADAV
jgi:hypothetical protein